MTREKEYEIHYLYTDTIEKLNIIFKLVKNLSIDIDKKTTKNEIIKILKKAIYQTICFYNLQQGIIDVQNEIIEKIVDKFKNNL
jgi:hypothetical protein